MGGHILQSVAVYLGLTLDSCGIAHCGGNLIAILKGYFATIGRVFILVGGLATGLSFYGD